MLIVGIERLMNWIEDIQCPYWQLYDTDRASENRRKYGDNHSQGKDLSVEEGKRRLRQVLENFNEFGGRVYVWATQQPNVSKGGYFTWFQMLPDGAASRQQPSSERMPAMNGLPPGMDIQSWLQTEIQKAVDKVRYEYELNELKKENTLLKSQISGTEPTALDRVLERVAGYVLPVMETMDEKKKIAGNNETDLTDMETRIQNALERLSKARPDDFVELLEMLAKTAEDDPGKIDLAKKFL